MSLPVPPNITQGQIALDPVNGVVYYKDDNDNIVATTWSWLRDNTSEITTDDNVTITGNLTVSGTTVSVDVETVTVADNILILNSNVTSTPTENAGIEIERGTSPNVSIRWNESSDKWEFTNDGSIYSEINGTATESLSWADPITVTLAGDLTGNVSFDGSENVTLTANVVNDSHNHTSASLTFALEDATDVSFSGVVNGDFLRYNGSNWINDTVNLATDTVGDYVSTVTSGTGISVTNTGGEGATPNIALDAVLDNLNDVDITSAASGELLEFDGTNWVNSVRPSSEPIGHEDKSDSVISFNESTREFSIAPSSSSYSVWCAGKRHIKLLAETVTIPDTSGLYYIYFNSSGDLAYKTTYFTWNEDTPTAYIYWNADDNKAYLFADERHGITLDWATHEYLHRTRGAAIANGFGVNNYTTTGDGTSDTHAQIDIANGTFFDEDLQVDIIHSATPTANTWEQVLQGAAEIPVFYRLNNHWVKDAATEFPLKQGSSRPQYNLDTAGTWSTVDIANNHFGISWIIATNNLNEPIIAVLGQADYGDKGSAEAGFYNSIDLTGFPIVEFRPLYKIIYECKDSYSNTPHAAFVGVEDLRSVIAADQGITSFPVSDHGSMTGLADDDHPQYLTNSRHNALDHSSAMSSVFLNDISDIQAATPSSDQVLAWNSSTSKWNARTFSASVESLDSVGDVSAPSPSSGDYLKWNGTAWVNDSISLDELDNVSAPSPSSGDFLKWSGTAWVNDSIDLATDTVGNYLSDITAGTGVSITHTPGEGSSAQIAIGQDIGTEATPSFNGLTVRNIIVGIDGDNYIGSTTRELYITTSDGTGNSSEYGAIIQAGATTSAVAATGQVAILRAGSSEGTNAAALSTGGQVIVQGGSSTGGVTATGGNAVIEAGTGDAVNGQVRIGYSVAESVLIGRSGKTTTVNGELVVSETLSFQQTTEKVNSSSITSNIMTCDYTTGAIYYQSTNPSANFTANFTNVPTTNGKAITFTIFVTQGATAYLPNAVQIEGSAQTIKWAQGTTPTPTANKIDIFSFTLIRLSDSWTVFGNANTNF